MPHPGTIVFGQPAQETARFTVRTAVLHEAGDSLLQTPGEALATFYRWPVHQYTDIQNHAYDWKIGVDTGAYIDVCRGNFHWLILLGADKPVGLFFVFRHLKAN
jgi:hypothetical protein